MGKNNNIIEINGRRYDAHSGEPIDGPITITERPKPAHDVVRPHSVNQTINKSTPARATEATKAVATQKQASKIRVHDAVKARPQTRTPQRSTTLMRSAVTKPGEGIKRRTKVQSPTDTLIDKPAARLQPKASAHRVDNQRLERAKSTAKSQLVNRFSHSHVPAVAQSVPSAQLPARPAKVAEFPTSHLESRQKPDTLDTISDMLERALQEATSHLEAAPVTRKRRLFWRAVGD